MGAKNLEGSRAEKEAKMSDSLSIPPEKWAAYKKTAHERWLRSQQDIALRRARGWTVARQAAALLKEQFGVAQVAVFGSLARDDFFHSFSDVDLAVWGLDSSLYYRAVSNLLSLDPSLPIDLVMVEEASDSLQSVIRKEGVQL